LGRVGYVGLAAGLVEVLELLPRELGMPGEVEVAAVGDPLELEPAGLAGHAIAGGAAGREQILDVARRRGVVRELVTVVGTQAQVVGADAELDIPALALAQ